MIESLKFYLIEWLGIATKADVFTAREQAIAHADELHSRVASIVTDVVQSELDKDERTLVFSPTMNITVDENRISEVVRDKIVEACTPGGVLYRK